MNNTIESKEADIPLPTGMAEFTAWSDTIISLCGPFADKDSMIFALCSILIHADAKHGALPYSYFVDRLRKSAANQVASQVFQDIKAKQAAEAAKQAEVTSQPEAVTSDDQQTKNA